MEEHWEGRQNKDRFLHSILGVEEVIDGHKTELVVYITEPISEPIEILKRHIL